MLDLVFLLANGFEQFAKVPSLNNKFHLVLIKN
jgi:hypothetical protein